MQKIAKETPYTGKRLKAALMIAEGIKTQRDTLIKSTMFKYCADMDRGDVTSYADTSCEYARECPVMHPAAPDGGQCYSR